MVRKLFKHEILAYLRIWIPMQIILQSAALLLRLLQFISSDNRVYDIVEGTSIFAYVMSLIVSFGLIYVFSIVRFYKNLFTNEGYLSFTLPVTTSQHIFVKLITSVMFTIMTIIGMLISFIILTAGDLLFEIVRAVAYVGRDFFAAIAEVNANIIGHLVFYVIEFGLLMLIATMAGMLLMYCFISIGQTFRKNRIVGAIVVYFIYTIIVQFIGSIFSVIFTIVLANSSFVDWINKVMNDHPFETIHAFFAIFILIELIMGAIYFAVSHFVISKKLNLE